MSPKSFLLTEDVHRYLVAHAPPLDPVLTRLIAETEALGDVAGMQIAPEQGALLTLLTSLVSAREAVEVGTFTGYSSVCIARGLAPGGRLLCCDVSEEWTGLARQAWAEAGIEDRIELRIAPALETLQALPNRSTIDLAFIDADKTSYHAYYEELVPRLRPGGLLLVDNTLWGGAVVEEPAEEDSEATRALRAFNDRVVADDRVRSVLLPVADGLTMARRN